jgi:hypothetical protein
MEHIAAFLLIVGCSNGVAECRELPAPTPVFETVEDCEALRPNAAAAYAPRFGRVLSRCVEVDPAMEHEDATIVWDVTGTGELHAALEASAVEVAADFQRREKGLVGQH